MSLLAVEGIYKDGQLELLESPGDIKEARVIVTFLPEESSRPEDEPTETVSETENRRLAGDRLIAALASGHDLGGRKFNREELYAERLDRFGRRDG
jgi:hypothetical protein